MVYHYWYNTWPDHGVPHTPEGAVFPDNIIGQLNVLCHTLLVQSFIYTLFFDLLIKCPLPACPEVIPAQYLVFHLPPLHRWITYPPSSSWPSQFYLKREKIKFKSMRGYRNGV